MAAVTESDLELATLQWFADLDYEVLPAENFDPDSEYEERSQLSDAILPGRLTAAIRRLNPDLDEDAIHEVLRLVMRREKPTLALENESFHRLLTDGVELDIAGTDGRVTGERAVLLDFANPDNNDWMVTRQLTVVDKQGGTGRARRLDVVVYVNGLPLAVFELKSPTDPQADIGKAIQQLRNYREDVPSLLVPNVVLVASDDVEARVGSITADASRYALWRTIEGEHDAPKNAQPLEVLVRGVFEKARFLDFIQSFVTFEHTGGPTGTEVQKKVASYHQFHAVRRAVEETARASGKGGDRRVGVVWHTQGSGKSLTMVFYARKLILDPRMENPTIVVLTDRNDLDDQLFGTFAMAERLLRQSPVQAESRAHLRELLRTASGGVYFTTIQKFAPEDSEEAELLSKRRNIIVIADEAHRSQYGFEAKFNRKTGQKTYGLAKHLRDALPGASFIGFTGTPVELDDKSTVEVFGNHISVYDILQAVQDKATVPIYYENRLARLDLAESERPKIDPEFEELTEGEEDARKEALKSEWSTVEALVGTDKRLRQVAKDLVAHYERRTDGLAGKALVVCMSRRIAADLYDRIVELRPAWHGDDDESGAIKVVITGSSSDSEVLRPHVRTKTARERLATRFKDPKDPLKLVIVRDMWLTGFDAPCLHTLYVDKPMRGHNLMQAIARVNRVFGDKPGGLVVDYIGIASFLKQAIQTFRKSGERGEPTRDKSAIVAVMLEQLEICRDVFHGFDIQAFLLGKPATRLALLPAAREHVLAQRGADADSATDGHERFLGAVSKLTSAFAGAMPDERCEEVRDEVAFYQAVRAGLVKLEGARRTPGADLQHAVRQIVSNALVTTEVVDVFAAAGLEKPDISVLSPEFLVEVQGMKHKNLAAALLERLLRDQVRQRQQHNVVQGKRFSEMLEDAIRRYRARTITNIEVLEELLHLAKTMREGDERGKKLKLGPEESAFYDALADNESAVEAMGDEALATIAKLLGNVVRTTATIDWHRKKNVQAKLRLEVRKLLKAKGYPPDQQARATLLVIEQAERMKINITEGASDYEPEEPDDLVAPLAEEHDELPYPIAVFDGLIASQGNTVLRVKTRRDAFEKALAFLAAVALGVLRDKNGGSLPKGALQAIGRLGGKPISMGGWFELACTLAALLPEDPSDPLVRSVRALVTAKGGRSPLAESIAKLVIPDRNVFAHQVTATEEAVAAAETELRELWRELERSIDGLREARLSARVSLKDHDPKVGSASYDVRRLHGSPAHFPLREETVRGKLENGWGYVMRGDRPISLAPIVACVADREHDRHDVYVARAIQLESGKSFEAVGVSGAGKKKLKAP